MKRSATRSRSTDVEPTTPINGTTRCAIYTRKSTEEGLEQEFNSLDAQRESEVTSDQINHLKIYLIYVKDRGVFGLKTTFRATK